MVRLGTIFTAREGMTPDFAALISNCAARYAAKMALECGDKVLRLESLISILSFDLRKGTEIAIIAEGSDEVEAAEAMRGLLGG